MSLYKKSSKYNVRFHSNSASVSKNRLVHQPMISGQMNGPVDSAERVEGSDEAVDPRKEGGDGGV